MDALSMRSTWPGSMTSQYGSRWTSPGNMLTSTAFREARLAARPPVRVRGMHSSLSRNRFHSVTA